MASEDVHNVSYVVCLGDTYYMHAFKFCIPYIIDCDVNYPTLVYTLIFPSSTGTQLGTLGVTGDLFSTFKKPYSGHPELQR